MNLPILQSEVKTMSSREIATLCDKEHRHVLRDIDNLNQTYEQMGLPKVGQGYYTTANTGSQQYREYLLTKEQTIDLITGYRADVRIRINRRWQELENQQPQIALPQDYLSALKALVTSEEQKQALAIENQALKPKAEQWQRFIDTDGLLPSRTIGKLLGFKSAQEFNKAIKEKRIAFKDNDGTWQFYADFKDKDIGKMVAWEKGEYNKAGTQLKWHTRAVEYFANLFNRQVQGGV